MSDTPPEAPGTAPRDDLLDVEAPPDAGGRVDPRAYAVPTEPGVERAAIPEDLIDVEAPPPAAAPDADAPPIARPEPGGAGAGADGSEGDLMDRAADALLRLAGEQPWAEITLRDVAAAAGARFAELYARAPGKRALLLRLSARLDRRALERIEGDDQPAPRDRLFEAMMSRLEVMEPHRDALLAIGLAEGLAVAPALPATARALLEGSGIDAGGGRGALRLAAVTAVWGRVLQVWRDDEGALNRTMAEIDKQLARADGRLKRVGAGF